MVTQLTIGQVAERTGAATSALRYWEDLGLIRSVRTTGNQRRYERADDPPRVLHPCRPARRPVPRRDRSRARDAARRDAPPRRGTGRGSPRRGAARLDEQIRRIEKLRDQLDALHRLRLPQPATCALNNPLDELADARPGTTPPRPLALDRARPACLHLQHARHLGRRQ